MGDRYLYDETLDSGLPDPEVCINRKWLYVPDQQNGAYSNQITFDTTGLQGEKWLDWSSAYLAIPFTMTMKSTIDITANEQAFVLGLKNGYYQLIDSMLVSYDSRTVVQTVSNSNLYVNYKVLTSMSADELKKFGPSLGIYPDSAGSIVYAPRAAAAGGDGFSNNLDLSTAATFLAPENYNAGFLKRRATSTAFPLASYGGIPAPVSAGAAGKNYWTTDAAGGAARYYTWVILAQVKLAHLSDFFHKMPLVQGSKLQITINYNSCSNSITTAANSFVLNAAGHTQLSGNTNPMMIGNATAANSGAPAAPGVSNNLQLACGIRTNSLLVNSANANPTQAISSCRLYVASYDLAPVYLKQLLDIRPIREVSYEDIYMGRILAVGSASQFNQLIVTERGVKYVVVMPFASPQTANVGPFLNVAINSFQSPFSSAGGTLDPLPIIQNFQVLVAGQNIFNNPEVYDHEAFMQELSEVNAINGGKGGPPMNGLIGQYEWDNAYRYYVANVGRTQSSSDGTSKSIIVSGTNGAGYMCDYYVFVVFERIVKIDMVSGKLVD